MRKGGTNLAQGTGQAAFPLQEAPLNRDRISRVPAMRRIIKGLALVTCIAICSGTVVSSACAQGGGLVVTFRNEMKVPVIVQGYTIINRTPRLGMALVVLPGKTVSDNNVPANSIRFYQVVDANRPRLQYIRDLPVQVLQDDINLAIRGVPPNVAVRKALP
jgi:hypothetical protein